MKLSLVRSLYKRGFGRQQVIDIFRFIDWVLRLPEEIDKRFRHEMLNFEENQKMPYISSVERIGMEIGRQDGLKEGLKEGAAVVFLRLLQRRFGPLSVSIHDTVKSADIASLELWSDKIFDAKSIEEIFAN
ncbi:MAG: DUF4351 domain-containing protein [Magnetococcales bacterium]|nr:DUF4351 domain-containing protein [Magnetococcales bacterium]